MPLFSSTFETDKEKVTIAILADNEGEARALVKSEYGDVEQAVTDMSYKKENKKERQPETDLLIKIRNVKLHASAWERIFADRESGIIDVIEEGFVEEVVNEDDTRINHHLTIPPNAKKNTLTAKLDKILDGIKRGDMPETIEIIVHKRTS